MKKRIIVLIRGLFREKRHWGRFPNHLRAEFPDYEIVTLNVPGAGERNQLDSPVTISEMVDDLRSQLSELYPKAHEIVLIGLSMGGMITLNWCQRFPEQVDRAMLINTSTRNFSKFYERLRWQQYGNILKSAVKNTVERERFSYELCSNMPTNEKILADWIKWAKTEPMSRKNAFNQLVACLRFTIDSKPKVPLCVLVSQHDKMVSPECSYALADKWNLPIKMHPSAGHDIPIDDPDWVIKNMQLFLTDREAA